MVVKIDTRNVQKTGNMHYVYLPTLWCKKYNIDSDSKVSTKINSDGTLMISPQIEEKELAEINLATGETTPEIITKLVIACYVNPTKSFNIKLGKGTDVTKLMDKGNVVSVLEFVEFDENIVSESDLVKAVESVGYELDIGIQAKKDKAIDNKDIETVSIKALGMDSPHCAMIIESALKKLPGIKNIDVENCAIVSNKDKCANCIYKTLCH